MPLATDKSLLIAIAALAGILTISIPQRIFAREHAHVLSESPMPGAKYVSPATDIVIRLDSPVESAAGASELFLEVTGSRSGHHHGWTSTIEGGRTFVFHPDTRFLELETVYVSTNAFFLAEQKEGDVHPRFFFQVGQPDTRLLNRLDVGGELFASSSGSKPRFSGRYARPMGDTLPLDFPYIRSMVYGSPSPGRIFVSNLDFGGPYAPYLLILDDAGRPIFYRRMQASCLDFKVQPNGLLTYYDSKALKFYAMDSLYAIVDSFATGNGYTTDLHEMRLLPNGHALLMAYDPEIVDMRTIVPGGDSAATVIGLIIQELDDQKNVIFQWRSWDHFQITDATHEDLTAATIDYVHGNAIELDSDGNLLISSRHLDEITKVDRTTGNILWRFGGKHNEFTFLNDPVGFSHQHDIRLLAPGDVTLFDNGNFHNPPLSRAVEYRLDENAKTASLTWEYCDGKTYGFAMGSVQRLPSGNTLVGWGAANPTYTEVTPTGLKVAEMTFDTLVYSYRSYRYPWNPQQTAIQESPPAAFILSQNYPNPFNNATSVLLQLPAVETITFKVYNVLGQEISTITANDKKNPGTYRVAIDGSSLSSGTYYYRASSGGFSVTRKMEIIK